MAELQEEEYQKLEKGSEIMKGMVETAYGPVPASGLGKVLIHEHFVFEYPGFQGDVTLGPFRFKEVLETGIAVVKKWNILSLLRDEFHAFP
ncbi:hypothetical protein PspKH34_15540 [Parageobacillus sp. KH3-4]|nr:hypothetical protein PspKH34_15540 [Parageobacillus sp. KH3-4]